MGSEEVQDNIAKEEFGELRGEKVLISREGLGDESDLAVEPQNFEEKYAAMPESAWGTDEDSRNFIRVAGIRFGEFGRVMDFDTDGFQLTDNDSVVVELKDRGLMMGWVSKRPIRFDNSEVKIKLKKILRKATADDLESFEKKKALEERGVERTISTVARLELPMKVLSIEYTLDRRKATVFFSSEKRVDFRSLLRELVHDLKAKVELRQVGSRDHAKQIGALGPCGEETCCSRFIDKFHGVSIKMAKDQGLSLKPTKVSGMCGRLKCCLAYENKIYVDGRKTAPKVGKCVKCKSGGGCGVVKDVDIPRQLVLVELDDGTMSVIPVSELIEDRTLKSSNRGKAATSLSDDDVVVATTDTDMLLDQMSNKKKDRIVPRND